MRGIEDAVETLLAVRGIEQIARELAGSEEEIEIAVHHAREVIDSIERFVTYLMGRARPLQAVN